MPASTTGHHAYRFGEFLLDLERGALLRDGEDVKLRPKSYEVLRHLVQRHGCLVGKQELLDAVWGSTIVTDGSITQCLIDIRRAIGDHSQSMIRTVPRRGYIFEHPVAEDAGGSPLVGEAVAETRPAPGASAWKRWWPMAAAAAIVLLALAVWRGGAPHFASPSLSDRSAAATAPPASIAVLPFVDMSPDHDQKYFSDGLSEEILNLLAQSSSLRVIARTSSFSFSGRDVDIATVAETLKVAYVLEGSVRKSGDRVRVTAQLVSAADSMHLWSQTYERDLDDVFAVQGEIANSVAHALKTTLLDGSGDAARPLPDSRAHERFLQARYFFNRRGSGDLARAMDYYRQALQFDPGYGRAWAGLAGVYYVQLYEGDTPQAAREGHRRAVEQALALAPDLAETQARAAQYYWTSGDVTKARKHLQQAMVLEPSNPLVVSFAAGEAAMEGSLDQAIELLQQSVVLDPLSAIGHGNLSAHLMAAGRYPEAEDALRKAWELNQELTPLTDPTYAHLLILQRRNQDALALIAQWPPGQDRDLGLALTTHALGREAEATAALHRLQAANDAGSSVRLTEAYAWRGETDQAFRWLDVARRQLGGNPWANKDFPLWWQLRYSPFLRPLHADPRWRKWVEQSTPTPEPSRPAAD